MAIDARQPGDFAAVAMDDAVGHLIEFGEWLNGDGFGQYAHALVYVGDGQIVEAMPGGALMRPRAVQDGDLWSTGVLPVTQDQREAIVAAANRYLGVPYSFADYAALAAHRLHIPVPGLRAFIADTGHMICSQLVDQCYADAGVHLFTDGRWPGYVTPKELANLCSAGASVPGPRAGHAGRKAAVARLPVGGLHPEEPDVRNAGS
jgi:cell wall-associated NlpC family hydrolase